MKNLQNTALEYKRNKILQTLHEFLLKLEKLKSDKITDLRFDTIGLRYDINEVKYITQLYEEHSTWSHENDLERVNDIYRKYIKYIKRYGQTI